jgi:YD repeat-containing protein
MRTYFVAFLLSALFYNSKTNGTTVSYAYDNLNRITNAAYSDGSQESYSYDNAGNRLSRSTTAATVQVDTTPPSVPVSLGTNSFTPSQLSIFWNPSTDTGGSGLAGYHVYVNGVLVGDTTATNFLLAGLPLDTESCITVAAFDRYTNISAASTPICVYIPSGTGSATVKIVPVLLAAQPSPSWGTGVDALIADLLENMINTNAAVAGPGNYVICNQRISWYNLALSQSTPMWDGILNPPVPWNSEYGHVVWALIDATSNTHSDDLSLDSLQVVSSSSDGNILGGTNRFATNTYTPRALAVKKDGTKITAGPASQKGTRILILVHSRLFNVGDTQSGLDQIHTWVSTHSPYTLAYTAEIIGDEAATHSTVSLTVGGPIPSTPQLHLTRDGTLSVIVGEIDRIYTIQAKDALEDPWTFFGTIGGTNSITIPLKTNSNQFFRALVQ